MRRRWLSPRALLLHLAVLVVAPGCAFAGWWQATRALAGNTLSWVYSVEWPIFALIAIAGWWQLIHEDPEHYEARKRPRPEDELAMEIERSAAPTLSAERREQVAVDPANLRLSALLALLVACEFVVGIVTAVAVPFNRPSSFLPAKGEAFYAAHALFGALIAALAIALVAWTTSAPRASKAAAWMGLIGVAVAGAGGLLTYLPSFTRFAGMAVMFAGAAVAFFAYILPVLLAPSRRVSPAAET